jgi:CheY-like chemotaxis protein
MKSKLHVLIAEDSEPDARLLIRELKQGGFDVEYQRVETAAGLQQALAEQRWDVILCDLRLSAIQRGRRPAHRKKQRPGPAFHFRLRHHWAKKPPCKP